MTDDGRFVEHFRRWYVWSRNERGNLELLSFDRLVDELREARLALQAEWFRRFGGAR